MRSFSLFVLGILVGLVISTHFTHKQVACLFDSWYSPNPICVSK